MTTPALGWPLAAAVVLLVTIAVVVAHLGRIGVERSIVTSVARAVLQLAIVGSVIAIVVAHVWASWSFVLFMFTVAVRTASGRIDAPRSWPWVAAAMAPGVIIVITIIFATGAGPWSGPTIISISGIIVGNTMTAVGLTGRRLFEALVDEIGQVEAGVAIGLIRPDAIRLVIEHRASLALIPVLDQTRTVGLVSLPGAFIGVLLGGGSPAQAAASQLLVLVGIITTQTIVIVAMVDSISRGRVLPPSLESALPPG